MDKWKPGVVYLKGPGLLRSLRSVRIRLHSPAAPDEEDLERRGSARGPVRFMWDYCAYPLWGDTPLSTELESSLQAWSDEGKGAPDGVRIGERDGVALPMLRNLDANRVSLIVEHDRVSQACRF